MRRIFDANFLLIHSTRIFDAKLPRNFWKISLILEVDDNCVEYSTQNALRRIFDANCALKLVQRLIFLPLLSSINPKWRRHPSPPPALFGLPPPSLASPRPIRPP